MRWGERWARGRAAGVQRARGAGDESGTEKEEREADSAPVRGREEERKRGEEKREQRKVTTTKDEERENELTTAC